MALVTKHLDLDLFTAPRAQVIVSAAMARPSHSWVLEKWPVTMQWQRLDPRQIPLDWCPAIFSTLALAGALTQSTGGWFVACICMGLVGLSLGQMMRRTEAAARMAARLVADVHSVGDGNPEAAMRAAARWGSDVLGRVARGEDAAEAVAGAALVEMADQSEAGSASSEQELGGFHNTYNGHNNGHASWIANALRSVTPDQVTPRDVARMGTVPEDVPYHGQPLVRAQPPVRRRQAHSPVRAATSSGVFG